jgi:hypothetical protein
MHFSKNNFKEILASITKIPWKQKMEVNNDSLHFSNQNNKEMLASATKH